MVLGGRASNGDFFLFLAVVALVEAH
jgi:hypothetical protein